MITSTTAAAMNGASAQTATSAQELKESYDSFLTLLTAQIANQDPLNPVDSTQFVSQLAQLSLVEQGIMTNTNLEQISGNLAGLGERADLQLIGHEVLVASDKVRVSDGNFPYSYQVGEGAADVKATIMAEDGTVVRELRNLSTKAGDPIGIDWDMRDDDGLPVPDGTFRIKLSAETADEKAVAITGLIRAKVDKVEFTPQGSQIALDNGETVFASVVRSVY